MKAANSFRDLFYRSIKVTESGSKIYMVNAKNRESNRTVTITIGRHNDPWTVQNAREQVVSSAGQSY